MEGLPAGKVFLVEHDGGWAESFKAEDGLLRGLLGTGVIAIEHIGSTAVPGLKAKPLVDLLVGLEDLSDFDGFDFRELGTHGYYRLNHEPIEGKKVIAKFRRLDPPVKTHVVHIVEHGGNWWKKHLLFRDRLRENPDIAGKYERLKLELAERYPGNERAYADTKLEFVQQVLAGQAN